MGYYGVRLLNLIKSKPALYKEIKEGNTLILEIKVPEELLDSKMTALIDSGLNSYEAMSLACPEIIVLFNVNSIDETE